MTESLETSLDENGAFWICLNRPKLYNAFSIQLYDGLMEALLAADENSACKVIIITGKGKYFTSGNDQNNFMDPTMLERQYIFRDYIDLLIDLKKPLIAAVNGPAVGMGVTTLALFDMVLASDQATFTCPFTRLALTAEGCSSYTFPMIMGCAKANDMLLFNKKATAQEMEQAGLVSRVIPHAEFQQTVKQVVDECCHLHGRVLMAGKRLLRPKELCEKLHSVNHHEVEVLNEYMRSPEALEVVMKFFEKRKSKL